MKTIISKSGKKITFRQPKASDLKAVYQYAKTLETEDTFITLTPDEPLTEKEEKEVLKSWVKKQKENKRVGIFVFDAEKIIGSCSIEKEGRRSRHIGNLGIALLKEYRSEKIGTKLIKHTFKLAQKNLQISKVVLWCLANNKVAINFYQKLGFIKFGHLPKANQYKGKLRDSLYFYKDLT